MLSERVSIDHYKKITPTSSAIEKLLYSVPAEHQARYHFAGKVINGSVPDSIIDAASGSGWGTVHLAQATKTRRVIGIDFDDDALEESTSYAKDNQRVAFHKADLLNQDHLKGLEPVDWIVSFETLEHFPKEAVPQFLANLKSIHTGNGLLIISSPNGPLFSPYKSQEGKYWYQYHFHEYSADELTDTLESNGWKVVGLFGQRYVDSDVYLKLSQMLYVVRKLGLEAKLPWDHRICRLPSSILNRFASLSSDEVVKELNGNHKQPIYLTALCQPF